MSVFADPAEARRERQRWELWQTWGETLHLYAWTHVAHLTFKRPATTPAAHRRVRGWLRELARPAQGPVPWFYCLERGACGRRVHAHALVAGTAHLSLDQVERDWNARHGRCEAHVYDAERGAAFYLVKLHRRDDAASYDDYDWSDRLPPKLGDAIHTGSDAVIHSISYPCRRRRGRRRRAR